MGTAYQDKPAPSKGGHANINGSNETKLTTQPKFDRIDRSRSSTSEAGFKRRSTKP